ncbi:caspase family protein [Amycolatopsis sp. NBC_01488]|uniref:caspase family protein n=1 Tax=Amycolatopsis sp. NBC_01488 TaxID=2903563 RepID=UPI002E288158|nr:caspase family protein [Amycolatopsis sp. NBC_01488]
MLSDPSVAGFEVTTLIDEPHHVVGEAIGEFYRGRRRDELTLLYFTGHGVKDDDGSLYLAMANTRRDSLMFTALAAELVDRAMAGCLSRQKVLVLDCCYSGAFPAGKLAKAGTDVHTLERFQGRGRAVLTASDATQYSFEGDAVVGSAARSVFTRHLVAGLRDGSADLDGDGDVTVDELYSYVHERVVAEMPRQRPKRQSRGRRGSGRRRVRLCRRSYPSRAGRPGGRRRTGHPRRSPRRSAPARLGPSRPRCRTSPSSRLHRSEPRLSRGPWPTSSGRSARPRSSTS